MASPRRTLMGVAALFLFLMLAASSSVRAQEPVVVKYPGGPDVFAIRPGQFQALSGAVIRWHVVYDNTNSPFDIVFNYLDVMDPAGVTSCDRSPPCTGARFMELLCEGADAPDPDGGTVNECDPVTGVLDLRSIPVAAGATSCVQFSTRILDSARSGGGVQNIGCVDVLTPVPIQTLTRPTTDLMPACDPMPGSGLSTGCSSILVPNIAPPSFSNRKTSSVADTNGNGVTDVGDTVTWTVEVTNTGTEAHDTWIYDPLATGSEFGTIIDNPDGACTWSAARGMIDCTVINLDPGEVATLRFTTTIACSVFTDDDTSRACNQAFACNDIDHRTCLPSDQDTVSPFLPTCVPVPMPDFNASTKTWSLALDNDGDGALSDGDLIRFSVVVRNDGSATATNVLVTDVLDVTCLDEDTIQAGAGGYDPATDTMLWLPGDMIPGQIEQTQITAVIIDTGSGCCNQAEITHDERIACGLGTLVTDDPTTPEPDDPTCVDFGPQPLLEVEKDYEVTTDPDGDRTADPGDVLTFTITIRNVGAGPASDVTLDDVLLPCWANFDRDSVVIAPPAAGTNESTELTPPATPNRVVVTGIGGPDGLAPLEVVTVTFPVTYEPGGAAGCCNEADISYAESPFIVSSDDPVTSFRGDPTCTTRANQSGRLEVVKTATEDVPDGCLQPGENVVFTIEVTARDEEARLVQITDVITDDDSVFDIIDPGTGTISPTSESIEWTLGDVLRDGTRTITWIGRFACEAAPGQAVTDVATAAATNAPAASSLPVTSTVSTPKLQLTKTFSSVDADASGTLSPGDTAIFDITVENVGDCDARSVVINDPIDADLDWTAVVADGSPRFGGGQLEWDEATSPELASLAPATPVTYQVRVPVLTPDATNPNPGFDGVVNNVATATAASSPSCPLLVASAPIRQVIDVSTAAYDLQLTSSDDDMDACHEPGEPLTINILVTPVGGAADAAQVVLSLDDPLDLLSIADAGGGVVVGNPETITWDLGTLPADVPVSLRVLATMRCDAPDAESFGLRADATSTNLAAVFDEILDLRSAAPVLRVTKGFSWQDDGDAVLDPGETVKYDILMENIGSCQVRNIDVVDRVDPDLDVTTLVLNPIATDDGTGGVTWSFLGLDPGNSIAMTIETAVLDPLTNPDPNANGFLNNEATAIANSIHGCPGATFTGAAAEVQIGATVGEYRLLRNDFITCLSDALTTMRTELLRQRPAPQECSEPPAIDPAHRGTQVLGDAVSPALFSGDADPASSFGLCPQTLVGFGRILVLYELDEPPPLCLRSLRVRKAGTAVEVTW